MVFKKKNQHPNPKSTYEPNSLVKKSSFSLAGGKFLPEEGGGFIFVPFSTSLFNFFFLFESHG